MSTQLEHANEQLSRQGQDLADKQKKMEKLVQNYDQLHSQLEELNKAKAATPEPSPIVIPTVPPANQTETESEWYNLVIIFHS